VGFADTAKLTVVADIGSCAALEPLALRIYGARNRPSGWFGRKLARERVDPMRSMLAICHDAEPGDAEAWLGYLLIGTPPSLGPIARVAGIGVLPVARRYGIARAMLDRAALELSSCGFSGLRVLVEPSLRAFYRQCGFEERQQTGWCLAFGTGNEVAPSPPRDWTPSGVQLGRTHGELFATTPEAWQAATARTTILHDGTFAHVSQEGTCMVVHRVLTVLSGHSGAHATAFVTANLLGEFASGVPVLAPLDSRNEQVLGQAGWTVVQRAWMMDKALS